MKGDPNFVILKHASWIPIAKFETRILGAVVKEFLNPTIGYEPQSPQQYYNADQLLEGSLTDFVFSSSESAGRGAKISLDSIAGFSFHGNREAAVDLGGKVLRYKRLQQHDRFWAELKKDEGVRTRVPRWISRWNTWPVCLVVGIMICEDVQVSYDRSKRHETEATGKIPLASAVVLGPSATNAGNVGVTLSDDRHEVMGIKGQSAGSSIFSLELKKVTTTWLRKYDLKLSESGPNVDEGRLFDDDDQESEDEEPVVVVEDLILEDITSRDLEDA